MVVVSMKNFEILLDSEDWNTFQQSKWYLCRKGSRKQKIYLQRTTKADREVYFHRIIMKCPKNKTIDHINGNTLDNRKENLRICSQLENNRNKRKSSGRSSRYIGVHYNKIAKNWRSQIQSGDKRIEVGSFNSEIEAAKARDLKAIELFGEFAQLNFKGGDISV